MITTLVCTTILLLTTLPTAFTLENGETICAEGYVMDTWCIVDTGGTLLDAPSIVTLEQPELHSVHCLVDVSVCRDSVFTILNDKEPGQDLHTVGYALDEPSKMKMIEMARESGDCTTCTGAGSLVAGFRAGMMATVLDADATPPMISIKSAEEVVLGANFCAAPGTPATDTGAAAVDSTTPAPSAASPVSMQLHAVIASCSIIIGLL